MKIFLVSLVFAVSGTGVSGALPISWATCQAQGHNVQSGEAKVFEGQAMNEIIASQNALYFCKNAGYSSCQITRCESS